MYKGTGFAPVPLYHDPLMTTPSSRLFFVLTLIFTALALLLTVAPTLYYLDSPELTTGAAELGLVHAPGYPLYLLSAHVFTWLPLGDVSFRANIFSAFCLLLTSAFLYIAMAQRLRPGIAMCVSLMFVSSYAIWRTGVAAEVYAPQLITVSLVLMLLVKWFWGRTPTQTQAWITGAAYGIAVAMHPSSGLLAFGVAVAFRTAGVSWRNCLISAGIGLAVFALSLLYFPLRFAAQPALNLAGTYNESGVFQPVNLQSLTGIWWMLSGAQFDRLFFKEGFLPSLSQILETLRLFWQNFLGIGVVLGLVGQWVTFRTERRFWWVWWAAFLPYTYFYMTYGAIDRDTMFGPSLLLWAVMIGFGLSLLLREIPTGYGVMVWFGLPLVFLALNGPLIDSSEEFSVRERAEAVIGNLPEGSIVFGNWLDVVPLEYLQMVENQRPDMRLYNVFLFEQTPLTLYVNALVYNGDKPVVFLSRTLENSQRSGLIDPGLYHIEPLLAEGMGQQDVIGYRVMPAAP